MPLLALRIRFMLSHQIDSFKYGLVSFKYPLTTYIGSPTSLAHTEDVRRLLYPGIALPRTGEYRLQTQDFGKKLKNSLYLQLQARLCKLIPATLKHLLLPKSTLTRTGAVLKGEDSTRDETRTDDGKKVFVGS